MAFQSGSQIRPELANADYSGFQNAANIQGEAMANFGASIASGIEGYKKRKKEQNVGRARIKRAEALGDSMIAMVKDKNPDLANSIAETLSMNLDESIPFDQRIEATEGFEQSLMNMFLLDQKNQTPTYERGPYGGAIITVEGEQQYVPPYKMEAGGDGMSVFNNMLLGDAERKELEELRALRASQAPAQP